MRFGLLGSLAVVADAGNEMRVAAPRQRTLLATLLLQANQPVPSEILADAIWDQAPPPGYAATLRTYVLRLRHTLGREAAARLVTRSPGYLFQVNEDELDVSRFEALCGRARTALRTKAWAVASATASQALELWRATPLSDVPSHVLQTAWVPRLEELRLQALEGRAEAEIQLGHCEPLLPELRELTTRYTLRENLHAALVRALAGAGQRGQALAAYQQARRVLVDELGIEPGPRLRAAQQQVLAADREPSPAGATAASGDAAVRRLPPVRQLPPAIRQFVGRTQELAALSELTDQAVAGDATVICVVGGTAGVGKTALVAHWAHRAASRFPDGQLYLNLRGFDPSGTPVTPADALRGFLDALGVAPEQIFPSLEARASQYRSLLADQRMLVVLDNARDAGQVRPLLPASPGCLVLVTSRDQLIGLVAAEGAVPVTLNVLPPGQARQMLLSRLGPARVTAEPDAVTRLAEICARLPLALSVITARASLRPAASLATLTTELENARSCLDGLDAGDGLTSVRLAISWSYRQLGERAARTFRLLGVHPGPDISAAVTASLTGVALPQAREALEELTRANLVTESGAGRFAFHDLLRAYAGELATGQDSQADRHDAMCRLLEHYLHSAYAATLQLYPARDRLVLPAPPTGTEPEVMVGSGAALTWLRAEYPAILAMAARVCSTELERYAVELPDVVATFLDRQGLWRECADAQHVALVSAGRRGDRRAQARAHRYIGRAYIRLGSYPDGFHHLTEAMSLFQSLGDHLGQARSHLAIAMAFEHQGRYQEALHHAGRALPLFRIAGHQVGQAAALSALGGYHAALGAHRRAIADCAQSLDLHRKLGNRDGEAQSWLGLGDAHHSLADYTKAISAYHHALNLTDELGQTYNQSDVLTKLGNTHHAAGDLPAARHAWQQALPILDDLRHPDADRLRTKLNETGLAPATRHATASRSGQQPPAPERPPPAGDNTH